jgi:hypothetical protein
MIRYKYLLFCDVAKMVINHKKFATFGYEQVMYLETCLNPSILWLFIIFYCKKVTTYILNFTQKIQKNPSLMLLPFKLAKLATRINIY